MRAVRNTFDTGRTVVYTIHQPSIYNFEALDKPQLLKRGGQVIYAGPLGQQSYKIIKYFRSVFRLFPESSKSKDKIQQHAAEVPLGIDFPSVGANSETACGSSGGLSGGVLTTTLFGTSSP